MSFTKRGLKEENEWLRQEMERWRNDCEHYHRRLLQEVKKRGELQAQLNQREEPKEKSEKKRAKVIFKNGNSEDFPDPFGNSWYKSIRHEQGFVIVKDDCGKEVAFPKDEIQKITMSSEYPPSS